MKTFLTVNSMDLKVDYSSVTQTCGRSFTPRGGVKFKRSVLAALTVLTHPRNENQLKKVEFEGRRPPVHGV